MNEDKVKRIISTAAVFYLFGFLFTALAQHASAQPSEPDEVNALVLETGWSVFTGEEVPLAADSIAHPEFYRSDSLWRPVKRLLLDMQGPRCWMKTTLPDQHFSDALLIVHGAKQAFSVYIDSVRLYESPPADAFSAKRWHEIQLGSVRGGETLLFSFFSRDRWHIGLRYPVYFGTARALFTDFIKKWLFRMILGFLYVLIGLLSVLLFFLHQRSKWHVLYFSLFSLLLGLFEIFNPAFTQLMLGCPRLWFFTDPITLYFFPVPLFAFFARVIETRYRFLLHFFWIVLLGFGLATFAGWFIGSISPWHWREKFLMLMVIPTIVSMLLILRHVVKGYPGSTPFAVGAIALSITGLHDIFAQIHLFQDTALWFKWGMFIFTLSIFYDLERRFAETSKSLEIYSKELLKSNEKLKEYGHTLELRVQERTLKLQQRNQELQQAFQDLKQAQNQLVMREKMASLGNLVAGVAHEINNPVGAVNSSGQVLEKAFHALKRLHTKADEEPDEARLRKIDLIVQENLKIVKMASERIAKIVASLKNFSRLDESDFQKADVHEGIDSTLTLVDFMFKNRIQVQKLYGKLPKIECYPNKLNQVFMNLFVNAAQAIEDKGQVSIRTAHDKDTVSICISDTGKGISAGHLEKIFDPGFTTKGVGVGTGLGLSISYNIIHTHHGQIRVESEPGKGTRFEITLPVIQPVKK